MYLSYLNDDQLTHHWYEFMEHQKNVNFLVNLYFCLEEIVIDDKLFIEYSLGEAYKVLNNWLEEGIYFLSETGNLYKSDKSVLSPGLLIGFAILVNMHNGGSFSNLKNLVMCYIDGHYNEERWHWN